MDDLRVNQASGSYLSKLVGRCRGILDSPVKDTHIPRKHMSAFEPIPTLMLSIQRALLGEVTDRLVSLTCGLRGQHIQIRAYLSGNVTEEDIERIQFVGAEVIADFPEGYTIAEACVSVDAGEPEMLDFWAFQRAPV
jgi:hypothetical protein